MTELILYYIALWYLVGLVAAILNLVNVKHYHYYVTVGSILRIPMWALTGPLIVSICVLGCVGIVAETVETTFKKINFDKVIW